MGKKPVDTTYNTKYEQIGHPIDEIMGALERGKNKLGERKYDKKKPKEEPKDDYDPVWERDD